MKQRLLVATMAFTSLLVLASINIAQAQWPALGAGFAVTTNWHGKDVLIGLGVTATAGWAPALAPYNVRNVVVKNVEFVWHAPNGTVIWDVTVPISGPIQTPNVPPGLIPQEIIDWANQHDGTDPKYPKIQYWYAQDTQTPMVFGDWGVQAIFHDSVRIMGKNSDVVRIRATSFNVVPEVPFGTMVILLSMFGALGVFALKRKHNFST